MYFKVEPLEPQIAQGIKESKVQQGRFKKKDETFIIESGKIQLEVGKAKKTKKGWIVHTKTYMMEPGDKIRLKPNTVHRYKSLTKKSLILEISTQHKDNDSYRIEKSRRE